MFAVSMAFFALAMGAGALAGVWWITSALRDIDARMDSQAELIAMAQKTATLTAPATLRAELDDLRGALDVMASSHRREFGKIWGKLTPPRSVQSGRTFDNTGDADVDALIALQNADTPRPQ